MSGELPAGWSRAKPSDLANPNRNALTIGPFGSSLKVSDYREDGVPLVFVREIRAESFGGPKTKYVDSQKAAELAAHSVKPGDLLITKMGDPPGDTAIYPESRPAGIITADCIKLTADSQVTTAAFLRYLFRSPKAHDALLEETKGVAQQKLSLERFRALEFDLPPLAEQRRIVAKLDALFERSRRAKASLDRIPAMLERLRQSILAAAFRGDLTKEWREAHPDVEPASVLLEHIRAERRRKWEEDLRAKGKDPRKVKYEEPAPVDASELPELPERWAWASLEELSHSASYGSSAKCDYSGTGEPVLRIPNVASQRIQFEDLKHALSPLSFNSEEYLAPGDLLIVRTNGSRDLIGRAAVVLTQPTEPTYFASYLIRFRLLCDSLLWEWVSEMWSSPAIATRLMFAAATSAGQYNLNLEKLAQIPIPIPPEDERRHLLTILDAANRSWTAIASTVSQQRKQVDELERATLAKAFRGELVPQDPNDEPASELLKRIRAEREEAESKPARGRKRAAG